MFQDGIAGCCGIGAVSGIESLEQVLANTGNNRALMLASTIPQQGREEHLVRAGFTKILTFRNRSTGNTVTLWGKGTFTLCVPPAPKPKPVRKTSTKPRTRTPKAS